jgi:hypothetical protein
LAGACQPFVLASGLTNPFGIAADGKNIYFDDNATGAIFAIEPVAKMRRELIAITASAPWTLTTDGKNVYWVTQGAGTVSGVWQIGVAINSSATQLVTGVPGVWGISVDASNVYYSTALVQPKPAVYPLPASTPAGRIFSVPIGGAVSQLIWPGLNANIINDGGITSIMVNAADGFIYFVNYQPASGQSFAFARKVKNDGSAAAVDVHTVSNGAMGLAVNSIDTFVSVYNVVTEDIPNSGTAPGVIKNSSTGGSWGWAIDAQWAYWVDSADGSVWKVPYNVSAGPTSVAANVGHDIRQIATDARGLYWTSFADGTVWMLAK